jgi:hypothetical protein
MFIHWMKHSSGPENAEIEELEVVTTIIRAIQKYVAAYESMHPRKRPIRNFASHQARSLARKSARSLTSWPPT